MESDDLNNNSNDNSGNFRYVLPKGSCIIDKPGKYYMSNKYTYYDSSGSLMGSSNVDFSICPPFDGYQFAPDGIELPLDPHPSFWNGRERERMLTMIQFLLENIFMKSLFRSRKITKRILPIINNKN